MARLLAVAAVLLSTALLCSGARVPLQAASAPAPTSSLPNADLIFIVSANMATFTAENSLVLKNVAQTAQFSATGGRSGIYPISYFTSTSAGSQFLSASGQWLDNPQAVLFGASAQSSNQTAVLLTLSQPKYDAAAQTLTFAYKQLPAAKSSLKFAGGAVGDEVMEQGSNTGTPLLSQIAPGTSLKAAALFIDMNQQALQPKAETKTFWFPWWGGFGGYNNCGWGCGGGYNGYNNGYNGYNNGGYYNNGGGYYNNNNNNNWGK